MENKRMKESAATLSRGAGAGASTKTAGKDQDNRAGKWRSKRGGGSFRFPVSRHHVEHFRRAANGQVYPSSMERYQASPSTFVDSTSGTHSPSALAEYDETSGNQYEARHAYYAADEVDPWLYSPFWSGSRYNNNPRNKNVMDTHSLPEAGVVPVPNQGAARFLGRPYQAWEPKSVNGRSLLFVRKRGADGGQSGPGTCSGDRRPFTLTRFRFRLRFHFHFHFQGRITSYLA